jgi:hypothetical protein
MKATVRRVGRYWIDQALLEEGYRVEDLFGPGEPVMELPELLDRKKGCAVRWLLCPRCEGCSQVGMGRPSCNLCGWNEDEYAVDSPGAA